jgi:phage repressor protein C with HTH and peptisase S24 domain
VPSQPVYWEGDTIIVSPAATIRKGDHVVVRTTDGQVMAKVLHNQSVSKIELASLDPAKGVVAFGAAKID